MRAGSLVAVAALAVVALGAGGSETDAEPALAARVDELRAVSAPVALPADRAPRFTFVGDSVATTIAPALVAEARARGVEASMSTRPGCGLLPGLPTTLDGFMPPWASACAAEIPTWRRQVATTPTDVVVVLSTWDGSPRTLDGAFVDPGTSAGRQTAVELFRQLVDEIAPPGSRRSVVFLAEAIPAPGATTGEATPRRINEARQHRAALRAVARSVPDRVRMIDLGEWLCPSGPQCPTTLEGIAVRADDGGHFTPDGAAWLAPRIADALGV